MIVFLIQNWPLLLFLAITAGLSVVALVSLRNGPLPYERRGGTLSPAQLAFLRSLRAVAGDQWLVLPLVRLADVLKVRPRTPKYQAWNHRLQGKQLDFALCDGETMEVRLAIELDDPSRRSAQRQQRDRFVEVALAAAGLPLLRVKAQDKYDLAALRRDIEDVLGIARKKRRA